jgi:hypothetical protein
MVQFTIDVFAWIPQPDVPNPIYHMYNLLPGPPAMRGPEACGPRFGGDNFVRPPATPLAWTALTYRAKQTLGFQVPTFGSAPVLTINTGVIPGTTTVLTAPRSAGGTVCHSLRALVRHSSASVTWEASDHWYRVKMHGEAQDPVPSAAGRSTFLGPVGARAAIGATPNLEWDLDLRVQTGSSISLATRARYGYSSGFSLDEAAASFPGMNFPGVSNLAHGVIAVRRYPSYIVYLTVTDGGRSVTVPYYFANANARALAAIAVLQTDVLRPLPW